MPFLLLFHKDFCKCQKNRLTGFTLNECRLKGVSNNFDVQLLGQHGASSAPQKSMNEFYVIVVVNI